MEVVKVQENEEVDFERVHSPAKQSARLQSLKGILLHIA